MPDKKKLAIAGAGVAGGYLRRLLLGGEYNIDIYDVPLKTKCGIHPCAWGTSGDFFELAAAAGLDAQKYVIGRPNHIFMDEVRIPAELATFDKPRFMGDLLEGAEVRHGPIAVETYDRVIDATGVARAYLPPIVDDVVLQCVQSRVRTEDDLGNRVKLGDIGYAWCFPLFEREYHIGCGSLVTDAADRLREIGWLNGGPKARERRVICGCTAKVRLTGPHKSQPFFVAEGPTEGVWGVGEAIGCVAPLAGDGIVPGMKCAKILLEHWNDPAAYAAAVLEEFRWMADERRVIDKMRNKERLGVGDALVLKENSKRMKMRVGLKEAALLLKRLL